jgi:hypothetical protein
MQYLSEHSALAYYTKPLIISQQKKYYNLASGHQEAEGNYQGIDHRCLRFYTCLQA